MWLGKRVFDLFFSSLGLLILSPLFLVIAILIKTDSEGPVYFRQKRVGKNEEPFFIHKFRTMYINTKGLEITVGNDSRITKIGKYLRKLKLDELPQLIDVFIGKMSIVGPRPEVAYYVEYYPANQRQKIFKMRPGITDWASIKFKDENAILEKAADPQKAYINEILPIKLGLYENYADSATLSTDVRIILLTLKEIYSKF